MSEAPIGWKYSQLSELAEARSSNVDKKTVEGEVPVKLCNYTDVYYNNKITKKNRLHDGNSQR
jgi:type I restriction enzyme S subunit